MKKFIVFTLCCLASQFTAKGDDVDNLIRPGISLNKAKKVMGDHKLVPTQLAMGVKGNYKLEFYDINDGTLIIKYSKSDKIVSGLGYLIHKDDNKDKKIELYLKVLSYNPETKVMTIDLK